MRTTVPVKFKFVSDGAATIAGYASIFGERDLAGDVVDANAFATSLKEISAAGHRLPMLWAHQQTDTIGSWSVLREDSVGLYAEGSINTAVEKGREALALVKAGDLSGLSIGYQVAGTGREVKDGIPHLTKVKLLEISLVAVPAAPKARITLKDFGDLAAYAEFLQSGGLPRREAEYVARKSWPAITATEEDFTPLLRTIDRQILKLKGRKNV
jgi:HK97 family phage prohead protease